jgi:CMP/dCMP kinase
VSAGRDREDPREEATMPTGIHQIIDHQMRKWEFEATQRRESAQEPASPSRVVHPCITVARQLGSGGNAIARGVAAALGRPICDREILDTIVGEGGIRFRLLDLLDEQDRSSLQIWVEGILRGRLADKEDYLRALVHAVGSVAAQGSTVFVGRGVNFLFGRERGGHLHLRVIAPLQRRIDAVRNRKALSEAGARALVEQSDADRAAFVRRQFHRDIDDPLAYDLVFNTASLPPAACVDAAVSAWRAAHPDYLPVL